MKKKILIPLCIFFLLFIIKVGTAQQEGCCLETGPAFGNKQCITTTRDKCEGRFFTGPPYDCSNVPECRPQTCIPKNMKEPCLRNKQAAECRAAGGVPDPRTLEEIPTCKPGCCIIAKGLKAEVLQYRQCEALTQELGFSKEMMEFREGITNEVECKKIGSPSDLGCCVLGGGSCKYGTRAECTAGNFVPLAGGLFCKDVDACAVTSRKYYDCGKLPGTEQDIYWFDSQGNQEDLKEACNYPQGICVKDKEGKAYCKSTQCKVNGTAQKMSDRPPRVEIVTINTTLITGTSICYNFYTHYDGKDEKDEIKEYLQRRSTGLQNQIIHCSLGKIEIEALGTDRQKLCEPANVSSVTGRFHANVKENKWQNCSKCGESKGFLGEFGDAVGDFLGPGLDGVPWGRVFSGLLGDYCTKEKCEALGDCYFHEEVPGWGGGTPIGSCDPIYPPGRTLSACGECGGGGDALWNLCTRAECYSKGDCYFRPAEWHTKIGTFAWYWPGLAVSQRIKLIIPECIVTTTYCTFNCAPICEDPACLIPANNNIWKCLGDRVSAYAIYAPAWIAQELLISDAWKAISGEVKNIVINKATEEVKKEITGEKKEGG